MYRCIDAWMYRFIDVNVMSILWGMYVNVIICICKCVHKCGYITSETFFGIQEAW